MVGALYNMPFASSYSTENFFTFKGGYQVSDIWSIGYAYSFYNYDTQSGIITNTANHVLQAALQLK